MFENKTVAVVVPCYNEETQVDQVLTKMPDFVDCIIVVDDASTDDTAGVVRRRMEADGDAGRAVLLEHEGNRGVGSAICTGYKEVVRRGIDVAAVMAGLMGVGFFVRLLYMWITTGAIPEPALQVPGGCRGARMRGPHGGPRERARGARSVRKGRFPAEST
jgi:cellulose synthase/poly-beta-1,6-N-acetylglucosamine synthase-like glycosyltransferase